MSDKKRSLGSVLAESITGKALTDEEARAFDERLQQTAEENRRREDRQFRREIVKAAVSGLLAYGGDAWEEEALAERAHSVANAVLVEERKRSAR